MTRKGRIVLAIILALVLITTAITAVLIHQVVQTSRLEELRNEALEELERNIGTYDEQSIVLNQTSKANAEELATLLGAELRITKDGRFAKLTLPEGTTIRDVYANDANLEHIEKMAADYQVRISDLETEEETTGERLPTRPTYSVSDTDYELQTYLDYLNMKDVWSYYNGSGVTVAVIDTGIDTDHPEFAGRISEYSYNATEDKIVKDWTDENGNYDWSLVEDEQGHGTAVTGVLAASMNGDGIVGIAPNVNIIVIKAECYENGTFKRTSDLVFGLYYAIERDVQVVNMSFGTYEPSNPFAAATQLAVESDIVCVAAAGNEDTSALCWPAADPNVIGVGALAADSWELASYSNYGENTNLVAPGTTYTSLMDGKYGTMNGTSLASPVVAGAIALFMQNNPYIMVDNVTEVLYASSYDLGDLGRDWTYGFGALDVNAFIREDRGTITFDMLTDELENTEGLFIKGHTLQELPEPERLYAVFDGWYYDDTFTQEYVYYEDKFYDDITLYAKWVNEDDGVPFTYVELEDGTIEIRSYTGRRRFITIPEKINGKVVSSIGEFAFAGQTRLREVGLPSGLTTIKRYAFKGCSNLVSMYIPENVTSVGEYAFAENVRLSTIAFTGNSRLKTVDRFAFSACGNLRSIELPATLDTIDGSAFYGDISLYEIKVQAGNTNFISQDGVLYNTTQSVLVAYPPKRGNSYILHENTRTIGTYAFSFAQIATLSLDKIHSINSHAFTCSYLERIEIPDSVTNLEQSVFASCGKLSSVLLGKGLTIIPIDCFFGCFSLQEIEIPSGIVAILPSAFKLSGLQLVSFENNSALTHICEEAFCKSPLTEIEIPSSVVLIDKEAFLGTRLTQVSFAPNSILERIGEKAFRECYGLKDITLPSRLKYIDNLAFSYTSLESVKIPSSVIDLGSGVFAYCSHLTEVVVDNENTVYHDVDGIVYNYDDTILHTYPAGKSEWEYFVENTVTIINAYAFAGGQNISHVGLPEALLEIQEYAFGSCQQLYSIFIPDNVLQIGRYAFEQDWNLNAVYFGENAQIPRLGFGAFSYTGLQSFTIPANVSTMAQSVFVGCPYLSSITFAENSKLESISAYMFNGCSNLQSIIFLSGSKLTSIQAHGLEGMDKLTSVDFGDAKLTNIDNFAFRFCGSLNALNMPSTVKNVGRYAFYGCKSLSELSLPDSIERIGSYAFLGTNDLDLYLASETMPAYLDENWDRGIRGYYTGVTNVETSGDYKYATLTSGNIAIIEYLGIDKTVDLTTVSLGAPITIIGGSAFKDSSVENIVLPDTLTSIQAEAFQYAPLKSISTPASVTFIGREAFAHTNIETLSFAENASLATIEQYAFEGTDKLTSVTIPASVATLGTGVFQKSGLTSVTFADGIHLEEIPQNAFVGTKLTTVTLPDSVKTVNHNAFRDILTLKTVSFGNSDGIRLLSNVFYNTGLESLHIPANVTYIGEYCFVGLEKLAAITVDENNPNYKSADGLLLTKSGRKLVTVPAGRTGSLAVPISVEEIGFGAFENTALDEILFDPNANILTFGYRAFFGAKNLTSIHVPASVVSIDYYAFAYCDKLHTVTFAEGNRLKGIYEGAFCGDINLENITIPDAIVEISDFAFYGCSKITSLPLSENNAVKGIYDYAFAYTSIGGEFTTPETLIDIGPYAFLGTKITKLTIPDTNKKDLIIGIGAFEECNRLTEITLPFIGASYEDEEITWFGYIFGAGAYEANQAYIPESLQTVTITDGITFVGLYGFYNCSSLKTISVPYSVSVLWEHSFENTTAKYELKNIISIGTRGNEAERITSSHVGKGLSGCITLSDNIIEVSGNTFSDCSYLESVVLPKQLNILGYRAFANCTSFAMITLPEHLETIEGEAFQGCVSLREIDIPDSVSYIGGYSFKGCTSLETVVLPARLTSIENNLFSNCTELQTITLPCELLEIQAQAFENCTSLKTIALPASLEIIDYAAFLSCSSLEEIYIPNSVKTIGTSAFVDCASLKSIEIPDSVTSFVASFRGCTKLEKVILGDGVTGLEQDAFYQLTNLKYVDLGDGITYIPSQAFMYCQNIDTLVFGKNIRGVGLYAFLGSWVQEIHINDIAAWCSIDFSYGNNIGRNIYVDGEPLVDLVIPEGVTSINNSAFSGAKIRSVVIPTSVTSIEADAFSGCYNLQMVYNYSDLHLTIGSADHGFVACYCDVLLNKEETVYADGTHLVDDFLYKVETGTYVLKGYVGEDVTIELPEKIAGNDYTVSGFRTRASKIIVPDGNIIIGECAFYNCYSLEEVVLGDGIEEIGANAFAICTNLKSVVLPKTLLRVGTGAFSSCVSLSAITIPTEIEQLGDYTFDNCSQLNSIVFEGHFPSIGTDALPASATVQFSNASNAVVIDQVIYNLECTELLYVLPAAEHVVIPYGVETIPSNAFTDCLLLKSVSIPGSVKYVGIGAFMSCINLETAVLKEGVTEIGASAFQNCEKLSNVSLPKTIESIESQAFCGCASLESIDIPETVTYIGSHAFFGCNSLRSIYLPEGIEQLYDCIFYGCTSLAEVRLPERLSSIGERAFYNCKALETIRLPGGITSIGTAAFANCNKLITVTLPDGIVKIPSSLFANCENLTTVTLPANATSIGDEAFGNCRHLVKIEIPESVASIGSAAFGGCSALQQLILPQKLERIGGNAFLGCDSITTVYIPANLTSLGDYAFSESVKKVCVEDLETWLSISFKSEQSNPISSGAQLYIGDELVTEVQIPESISHINDYAFYGCSSLTKVTIPSTVESIGKSVFGECSNLQGIIIEDLNDWYKYDFSNGGDNPLWWGKNLYVKDSLVTHVDFPESMTVIPDHVFCGCASLQSVAMPNTITTIGEGAFYNCANLNQIKVSNSLQSCEPYAFGQCTSLIELELPHGITSLGEGSFVSCCNLLSIGIPESITTMGNYMFSGCEQLFLVEWKCKLDCIPPGTFNNCKALTQFTIPEGTTCIGYDAFRECLSLTSVTLPTSLSSIDANAFYNCRSLQIVYNNSPISITFGESWENGGIGFFLRMLIDSAGNESNNNVPYQSQNQFVYTHENGTFILHGYLGLEETIVLPENIEGQSYTITRFKSAAKTIIIPEGITSIDWWAFEDNQTVETVVLPSSVKYIGMHAFLGCCNLKTVVFSEGLERIDYGAFSGCENLTSVQFPSTLEHIGNNAFSGSGVLLSETNWQNGFLVLNGWVFDVDPDLTYLPNLQALKDFSDDAFNECYFLKETVWNRGSLPSNVKTLYVMRMFTDEHTSISPNLTLENIVICNTISTEDIRWRPDFLAWVSNVTIFVDGFEEDLRWDDNFPGWSNGNKVVYRDQWSWVTFYDTQGNIIYREPKLNSEVIRRPFYEIEQDEQYSYVFVGWDLNNDGIADRIPATSVSDLEMHPIVEKKQRLYTIDFADQNGTVYYSTELPYGSIINLPENPTKQGYDFLAWSNYTEGMTVSENTLLHAIWVHHGYGHIYAEPIWAAPTCAQQGYYKHMCTICGEFYMTGITEAMGHRYNETVVEATCETDGYTLHTCNVCGDNRKTQETKAMGHRYSDWITVVEATCQHGGESYRQCSACGFTETQIVDVVSHSFEGVVTKEPTCDKTGRMTYACSECGTKITEELATIPHDYQKKYASKLWLQMLIEKLLNVLFGYEGDQAYCFVCSRCDRICTVEEAESSSAGAGVQSSVCKHQLSDWEMYLPGTGAGGRVEARYCTVCKKAVEFRTAEVMHQHTSEWIVAKEASCTEDGNKQEICSTCGELLNVETIPSVGHTWSDWYDVALGVEERSCETCGETESRDKTPDFDVDGNGTVEEADLTLLMSILVGNTETDVVFDFDFDGELTIYDGVLLMQQIQ